MQLNDVLRKIADYAQLDADALIAFAAEDTHGGRGSYDGWSIDADEGKLLYALVRALKPAQSIEIGVRQGASTEHLLAAIEANGSGHLDSYDIEQTSAPPQPNWIFHQADALTADFPPAEFVFEDGGHGLAFSLGVFEKLKAFAHVVVTHDTNMTTEHGDFHVKEAFETVFPDGVLITIDGCERGMGVWVNPNYVVESYARLNKAIGDAMEAEDQYFEAMEADPVQPKAPVKKPAARKPAAKRTAKK